MKNIGLDSPEMITENLNAKLDLIGECCHLKHAPKGMEIEIPQAVNFLSQNFGVNKSITESLRIPICEECVRGLHDKDWALVYCISCNSSQWIYVPTAKIEFNTNVVWVDQCPECEKEVKDA